MATSSNQSDGDHGFQIAPMVDVVFVLLLFFMACAAVKQTEKYLSITLPNGPGTGEVLTVIDITAQGGVSINGQEMAADDDEALTRLRAWFDRMTSEEVASEPVIIRPTPDAQHGRVIQVMDVLKKRGFKKISFT
jgi:biopolymer transport protein ExbD